MKSGHVRDHNGKLFPKFCVRCGGALHEKYSSNPHNVCRCDHPAAERLRRRTAQRLQEGQS